MKIIAILAALSMGLAGCAQPNVGVVTAAGKSYVMLHGVDAACVHRAALKELADYDWRVKSETASQIVAERVAPPWLNTAVLTVGFEPPQVRMTLTILPSGSDVKVLVDPEAIINPGSSNERVELIRATARMNTVFDNTAHRVGQVCKTS